MLAERFVSSKNTGSPHYKLEDGSRVVVIGGGPTGSFFSYFLLDLAERMDIKVGVDIYEAKDFSKLGPMGCNNCGGIVSESLIQHLAAEGINIPSEVVQRGLDAYVLHTDVGSVRIDTPVDEKRIAAMYRGAGPLGTKDVKWASFDGYLQQLAKNSGAQIIHDWVNSIDFDNTGRPVVSTRSGTVKTYDLIVMAVGVNSPLLKTFKQLDLGYKQPEITKTSISEFYMGSEMVKHYFGDAMHVFLLDIPNLEFAALIPKGDFVTMTLLGNKIDKQLLQSFLERPEVKKCFPPDWDLSKHRPCQCFPFINVESAVQPYANRLILVGDCAATKLYKNGIGAAYATAKAAATTAILEGISTEHFRKHYWPSCQSIKTDNTIGKWIFFLTRYIQRKQYLKQGILRVVNKEKHKDGKHRHMSSVLWDLFTGSSTYKDIFFNMLHPGFIASYFWETIVGILPYGKITEEGLDKKMTTNKLGRIYKDGETIVNQGDEGDCMYVIQSGKVEIVGINGERENRLAEIGEGEFFGEMALFENEVRSTTVRALGDVRVISIDKKTIMRRIQEDPSIAFRMLQKMSSRIRNLDHQIKQMNNS
jgi:flavin-dependent dehydrogenase